MNLFNVFRGNRRPRAGHAPTGRGRNRWRGSCQLHIENLENRTLLSYSFTLIAEASDRSSFRIVNNGTINQEGRVAYLATLHSEGQIIQTSDGASSRIIAVTSDLWESSTQNTPINAQGMVSIRGNMRGGGQVVLRGDGGPLTRIADTAPKSPFSQYFPGNHEYRHSSARCAASALTESP